MTGTVLVGNYSVVGKDLKPANPERYELKKVSKLADDLWVFEARIKYGQTDVTLPLTLRMIWAEDTPMISLTNANLPGLGACVRCSRDLPRRPVRRHLAARQSRWASLGNDPEGRSGQRGEEQVAK